MFSVMFMSKVARFKRNMAAAKAQTFEAAVSCESMCRDQHPAFTIVPDLIEITIVPRAYRKRMKNIRLLGDQFFSAHPKAMYCLFAAPTGLCLKLEVLGPLI